MLMPRCAGIPLIMLTLLESARKRHPDSPDRCPLPGRQQVLFRSNRNAGSKPDTATAFA
jgi:hypothetical protein